MYYKYPNPERKYRFCMVTAILQKQNTHNKDLLSYKWKELLYILYEPGR
jgi:hypothetical protein